MIKGLIRYFLFLCIFLLSGFGSSPAYAHESARLASAQTSKSSVQASSDILHSRPIVVESSFSHQPRKRNNKAIVEENEVEDEECFSSEKYYKSVNFFAALLCSRLLDAFFSSLKTFFGFWKHFTHISSYKFYLMFRVFRL